VNAECNDGEKRKGGVGDGNTNVKKFKVGRRKCMGNTGKKLNRGGGEGVTI